LGFWFASSTQSQTKEATIISGAAVTTQTEIWEATDRYAFFYRRHFEGHPGAEARCFAGWSGEGDGYIGADAHIPVGTNLGLRTGFAYLIPTEASGPTDSGHIEESWNLGISVVWYPGCRDFCDNYFRPLFEVADNGSFMVDRMVAPAAGP
jgi:hypothetical protein